MSWREAIENSDAIQFFNDIGGRIRYGVPTYIKETMAIRGEVPGHDPKNAKSQEGLDVEQRRAAAYLFGRNYPNLAPMVQPAIDSLRSGDAPEVLAVTQSAVERGSSDAEEERRAAMRANLSRGMALARHLLMSRYGR